MSGENIDLLLTHEVAELLRKPASTLRYWRSKDEGPRCFRNGSTVVYRRSDVLAWLADQESKTARGGHLNGRSKS